MSEYFNNLYNTNPELFNIIDYNPSDMIFSEKEICDKIGLVLKGEVVISTITYNEKEETINIIKAKEVFGDVLIFSTSNFYLGSCIAFKKSRIAFIKKDVLLKHLITSNNLLLFLNHISDKALSIKMQAKLLSHKNIEDRIMYYLFLKGNDNIYIPSITYLSKVLSLPRPSVSRSISNLIKKGYIEKNNKFINVKRKDY